MQRGDYVPAAMACRQQLFTIQSFQRAASLWLYRDVTSADILRRQICCLPPTVPVHLRHGRQGSRQGRGFQETPRTAASPRTCPQVHTARQVIDVLPPARKLCSQRYKGLLLSVLPAPGQAYYLMPYTARLVSPARSHAANAHRMCEVSGLCSVVYWCAASSDAVPGTQLWLCKVHSHAHAAGLPLTWGKQKLTQQPALVCKTGALRNKLAIPVTVHLPHLQQHGSARYPGCMHVQVCAGSARTKDTPRMSA